MRNQLLSVGLLLSAACGVSPTAAPTTYYEFLMAQNQVVCEAQARCCGVGRFCRTWRVINYE